METSGITQIIDGYLNNKSTVTEITNRAIDKSSQHDDLNIFITKTPERAIQESKASEKILSENKNRPLEGVPYAVKDNYCTKGILTTAASKMLANYIPPYESKITELLQNAGAIMVGKTNLDEFAMGSSTENSAYGTTYNPVGKKLGINKLVAGGSSGGSAAAVAAGIVPFAIGSDTGGSVRQPASFCGVVGFKPTYGVCSRWGIIAYASSFDQCGVFANSVEDVAKVMSVIAGEDKRDATSQWGRQYDFASYAQNNFNSSNKLKIGFPKEFLQAEQNSDTKKIWDTATQAAEAIDAEIVEISLPNINAALSAYYILALAEASSNLARYDGIRYGFRGENIHDITELYENTRARGFGSEVKRRVMMGAFALSSGYYDDYFIKAAKIRKLLVDDFANAFEQCDVVATPTAPSGAFFEGAHTNDPVSMYLEDLYTTPVNMAGLPAISIPAAKSDANLPLGLQLIGAPFKDEKLLHIAELLEQSAIIRQQ